MRRLAASLAGLLLCLFAVFAWAGPGGGADGLVAIPTLSARVTDLTGTLGAGQKVALEQKTITNIRAGKHDTSWVDARLKAIGCDPTPR